MGADAGGRALMEPGRGAAATRPGIAGCRKILHGQTILSPVTVTGTRALTFNTGGDNTGIEPVTSSRSSGPIFRSPSIWWLLGMLFGFMSSGQCRRSVVAQDPAGCRMLVGRLLMANGWHKFDSLAGGFYGIQPGSGSGADGKSGTPRRTGT